MNADLKKMADRLNRRVFMKNSLLGLGSLALKSLVPGISTAHASGLPDLPHYGAKVKRVIYLFQSGAPSQMELFDYKPVLKERFGEELPASVRGEQRVTGMTSNQRSFPLAMGDYTFSQYGESGAWLSNLLPHHQKIVDDVCFVKSMYTEAINHDPAVTFIQTGSQ